MSSLAATPVDDTVRETVEPEPSESKGPEPEPNESKGPEPEPRAPKDALKAALLVIRAKELQTKIQALMDEVETKCGEYITMMKDIEKYGGTDGEFRSSHDTLIDKLLGRNPAPKESPLLTSTDPYATCRTGEDIIKCIQEEIEAAGGENSITGLPDVDIEGEDMIRKKIASLRAS